MAVIFIVNAILPIPFSLQTRTDPRQALYFMIAEKIIRGGTSYAPMQQMDCELVGECSRFEAANPYGYRLHVEYDEEPSEPFTPQVLL